MTKKTYTGINIQWPISREILAGRKSIETRFYPIPPKYLNQEMLLIETPGKQGEFKSRIAATIKFIKCFKYKDPKSFYADYPRHRVNKNSPWAWKDKPKWGWYVEVVKAISPSIPFLGKKGIIYTKNILL